MFRWSRYATFADGLSDFQAYRERLTARHVAIGAPTVSCGWCNGPTMVAPGLAQQIVDCEVCGRAMRVTTSPPGHPGVLVISPVFP